MAGLAVLGAAVVDEYMSVCALPKSEESILATSYSRSTGGKAANQAAAASLSGCDNVLLLATVGSQSVGDGILADLSNAGVNVANCQRSTLPSGRSFIVVDDDGRQTVTTWPGASEELTIACHHQFIQKLSAGSWLSLQGEIPDVASTVRMAHDAGLKIVLNPSPVDQFSFRFPWKLVEIVIVNYRESRRLSNQLATAPTLITSLGAKGVVVRQGGGTFHLHSAPMTAIDTTGAGDALAGVMTGRLAAGADLPSAVRSGVAAAAISVTRRHCIPSYPSKSEIEALLPSIKEQAT